MMLIFRAAVASLFLSTSVTAALAADFSVPVDGNFWEGEVNWNGGYGKAYEFLWYVFEHEGQLAICGAGKFLDATTRSNTLELLRKGTLELNGRAILKDLTFFTKVKGNQSLIGSKATCRNTGAKAAPDSEVNLNISGRGRF